MASTISAGTSAGTAIAIAGDTSGALALQTNNGTTAVTITTGQNVGIGNTTPTDYRLVVDGEGSTGGFALKRTGTLSGSGALRLVGSSGAEALAFSVNGTERMRITYDASILIAKTASSFSTAGFEVAGDGSTYITKTHADSGGAELYLNRLNVNGPTVYFYKDTSNVGNISVTGSATAYNTSSDYRLKEDIAPMVGALTTVSALKPVTYKWKLDGSNGQGFIAHELAEVVPDCVTGEKDALDSEGNPQYQGVDVSFLVATLTAAIQELNAKVEAQATTIAELQAKVG